jgi:hypothetical protein
MSEVPSRHEHLAGRGGLPYYTEEDARRDREAALAYDFTSGDERRMTRAAALLGVLFVFFALGYAVAKAEGEPDRGRVIGKERTR